MTLELRRPLSSKERFWINRLLGGLVSCLFLTLLVHGPTVGSLESAQIIESNTVFSHHLMGTLGGHLANIERVTYYKVVNAMCGAEVETEQVGNDEPLAVEYLALLHEITVFNIAEIVHVRTDEVDAERAQQVRGKISTATVLAVATSSGVTNAGQGTLYPTAHAAASMAQYAT